MKLDATVMRTMSDQDFRVIEAVEKGMQRHSLVPAPLISNLANLRHGGTGKIMSSLLRDKLLSHDKSCGYDGYRLTNAGYDILALHALKSRKLIAAIGDRIGTGKESDIYLAVHPNGTQVVLKIHRLGRTSFRNVKKTRDYFMYNQQGKGGNQPAANQNNSWLFLSRKSALKEYAFMKALYNVDYPTPQPIGHSRHIVVMSLIRGVPLYQVSSRNLSSEQAASIFHQASDLALRLAKHGLVHCDLNEFNLLVDLSGIQQMAMSQEHDPYARHSGLSVAAQTAPGMLSARGPWETEDLQQHQPGPDAGSLNSDDKPPEPVELLDSGEPKPVVTLIDFPQMVSTQHPNAQELYERDTACLYKFFTHKMHFQIPKSDEGNLFLSWEAVQQVLKERADKQQAIETTNGDDDAYDDDESEVLDTDSVCLASQQQLRLDQQLKASGYSQEDSNRDNELYYYYSESQKAAAANQTIEENGGEDDDEDSENDEDGVEHEGDGPIGEKDASNDDDGYSLDSMEDRSVMTNRSAFLDGELANLSRDQLQEKARQRVKQQLEMQKKKGRQRGAFRKRNSNKTYLKGKRVYQDFGI